MQDGRRKTRIKPHHEEDDDFDWREAVREAEEQKEAEAKYDIELMVESKKVKEMGEEAHADKAISQLEDKNVQEQT